MDHHKCYFRYDSKYPIQCSEDVQFSLYLMNYHIYYTSFDDTTVNWNPLSSVDLPICRVVASTAQL